MTKTVCAWGIVFNDIACNRNIAAFGHRIYICHDNRPIIRDLHTDDPTAGIAVTVCGGNDHLVGNDLIAFAPVLIRGFFQIEGVVQPARGGIVASNFKVAFIRRHTITGQLSVFIDDSAINANGSHAIGRGHSHAAGD